jgi:glycosyltransferase involved in cell wall biosynthesis
VPPGRRVPVQLWCDEFPVASETFVAAEAEELARLGHPVEVVASRRPERPAAAAPAGVPVHYLEDDSTATRLLAAAALPLRHPRAVVRDRRARRRWRVDERVAPLARIAPALLRGGGVAHAHFAAEAALGAMRGARVTGRPWSLTAHAYDIYDEPRNLAEKLRSAALVTSGCDYTVRDLRAIAGPEHAERVVRVVMGVDPERFRRATPHPAARTVLAVGRLVEKKGFVHLVRAAAEPALAGVVERITIVGEGPLREELEREIATLGLEGVVELAGRREHGEVRELLESAALVAVPCVVAASGDRDSMPVVAKEALAMEVPVVASDEVGLPELIRPEFGRLVPPGDAPALAAALAELLALAPEERAAMGRAGREHVERHANVHVETARLSELLDSLNT